MRLLNKENCLKVRPQCLSKEEINEAFKGQHIPTLFKAISFLKKIDNTYYIAKPKKLNLIFHELIGSLLADKLDLQAAKNTIGYDEKGHLYSLSEVFVQEGCDYYTAKEYFDIPFKAQPYNHQVNLAYLDLMNFLDNDELLERFLKLTALDFKMFQTDRTDSNLQLMTGANSPLTLAPAFDFEQSYQECLDYYFNSFLAVKRNHNGITLLSTLYPSFQDYVQLLGDISFKQILDEINETWAIKLTKQELEEYEEKDETFKRMLTK